MGCDGGTIPKRNEIVKNKQKEERRDKNSDLSAKWQFCALSGLPLKRPIVACQLGRLYNKDAIIEHLLDSKSSASSSAPSVASHIRSLRDVKELNLKEKADFDRSHQASSGREKFRAQFVCPISGLELNGKYKFYYILTCACVLSERAFKQVPNEKLCISCSKPYDPETHLIVLNGSETEVAELKARLVAQRKQSREVKKTSRERSNESSAQPCEPSSSSSRTNVVREKRDMGEICNSTKRPKIEATTSVR